MDNMMNLVGKKIVITGASSGIGKAVAICCSNLGAKTVLIGRNKNRLTETLSMLNGSGHSIFVQDFDTENSFGPLFEKIVQDGIKLNGLVHSAGIPCVMPLKALSRSRLHQVMNVNFYSFIELSKEFCKKKYSEPNSSIVAFSAALVSHPRPYELAYIASKAALEVAVKVIALECEKRKIRVNSIAPGAVKTEMVAQLCTEHQNADLLNQYAQRAILGWQSPEDIANVCAFLLSDAAASITASNISADAGLIQ